MTPGPLADRWHTRDFKVLVEIARQVDAGGSHITAAAIARTLELEHSEVINACVALDHVYIDGNPQRQGDGSVYVFGIRGLTERGRRVVGLWPDENADADALIQLLEQAAGQTGDAEQVSALKRAANALRTVPASVLAGVTTAIIQQQIGI